MTAITPEGFQRTRLDERLAQLQAAMKAIFGPTINLDPDTIDGQTLGIYAESISNIDQLAEDVYQSFNPQYATGLGLSRLVQLNGIRRIQGAFSTVALLAVGTSGTIIPAGSLVRDPATNIQFTTIADATIPSTGEVSIPSRCTIFGPFAAVAGSLTKIDTPIFGWQTVTNLLDAVPGRNEETDEQLRLRRAASTSTPAQAVIDSIFGAIANIPDVRQVRVFENDQDTVQPVTSLPPHSIYAVVEGGSDVEIAKAIFLRKTAGTTTVGPVTVSVSDTQANTHDIRFSRPVDVPVYITINLTTRPGWPGDGADQIKTALVAFGNTEQMIGEELIYSRLFSPINTIPGFAVDSMYIGVEPGPVLMQNIAVAFNQLPRIDSTRIIVNVTET